MKTDHAYRGYLIRTGLLGDFFIGKDGHWISCHRSETEAEQAIDNLIGVSMFYVSVVDGKRHGLLLGPFVEHADALARVEDVRAAAERVNDRAVFYAFGTCKAATREPGKLNDLFPDAPIAR